MSELKIRSESKLHNSWGWNDQSVQHPHSQGNRSEQAENPMKEIEEERLKDAEPQRIQSYTLEQLQDGGADLWCQIQQRGLVRLELRNTHEICHCSWIISLWEFWNLWEGRENRRQWFEEWRRCTQRWQNYKEQANDNPQKPGRWLLPVGREESTEGFRVVVIFYFWTHWCHITWMEVI